MNRIAIVGHPSSGYMDVEALLKQYGMAEAAPSRREGMSVHDIQASLCKAHSITAVDQMQLESELPQLEPSAAWQGLALDLLLGNMEQPSVWGWSDSNTLPLLNMWHDVDEQTFFLLIYQHPSAVLRKALSDNADASPEALLNNWVAYNSALLAFYLRHPERCQLVHTKSFLDEPEVTLERFRLLETLNVVKKPRQDSLLSDMPLEKDILLLSGYLHQELIAQHDASTLYEELQSSSMHPSPSSQSFFAANAWHRLKILHHEYIKQLSDFEAERKVTIEIQDELGIKRRSLEESHRKIESCDVELRKQIKDKEGLITELSELKKKSDKSNGSMLEEENTIFLAQLHLLQDELAKVHAGGVQLPPGKRRAEDLGAYYGADDRIKRQLTYRLGATVVNSKGVIDYLLLPYRLINAHALYKQDLKRRKGEKLPPINQYADAHKIDRVKGHLSYRLGQVVMKNASSPIGWIKMPFALSREEKAFRRERQR